MPGLNQTGPMGQGPMTGRRMGRCTNFGSAPNNQPSAEQDGSTNTGAQPVPGSGFGRGWGFGGGRGFGFGNGRGRGFGNGRGGFGMGRQNRFMGGY